MEYLVPVLAVVVIGALAFAAARWMSASRDRHGEDQRTPSGRGLDIGAERAGLAAGMLDEDAHRRVYGHIAQSRVMEAVRDYRAHTGRSLKDAVLDVQSLALHPQVYSEPAQEQDAASAGPVPADHDEPRRDDGAAPAETPMPERPRQDSDGRVQPDDQTSGRETSEAATDPEGEARQDTAEALTAPHPPAPPADALTTLTVPAEWSAAPTEEEPPFEVEVMRGMESVRLSSQDLPPWLRDQLSAMVRDGNLESAAVQLSSHSELSVPEAYELLRRMRERRGED